LSQAAAAEAAVAKEAALKEGSEATVRVEVARVEVVRAVVVRVAAQVVVVMAPLVAVQAGGWTARLSPLKRLRRRGRCRPIRQTHSTVQIRTHRLRLTCLRASWSGSRSHRPQL